MTQLTVTLWNDRTASHADRVQIGWDELCAQFAAPPVVEDKAQAQLFTLAEPGEQRTENGSLRSNDNVVRVWGVCGDYDGETVDPWAAADALQKHGVQALVYTSPSHRAEAPRWRIVAPFDSPLPPDAYAANVEKLNTIVGGVLSSESFTLSQPYYVGRIAGREGDFRAIKVAGASINLLDIPRTPWRGARRDDGGYRVDTDTLMADLVAGIEIHPAIVALAARGFTHEELEDVVRRHMHAWERPERGLVAIAEDIPRACQSWDRKKQRELERKLSAVGVPPPYGSTPVAVPRSDLFNSVSAMTSVYTQTQWLIRNILDHPSMAILFGDPGVGKSFVAIDWACCVALGRRWQGEKVKQGGVLYLAGEGFNGLAKRFLAWRIQNGASDAEWSSAPLYVSRRAVDLLDTAAGTEMWEAVEALGVRPALIVIDTLSRMTPGMDENAAKEMSQFVQWCDKVRASFGCTIVVVHHSGIGDKGRVRGSTVLKGAADVEIGAAKEPGSGLRLFNSKMKEGQEFADRHFKLTDVQLPWVIQPDPDEPGAMPRHESSAVLVATEPPKKSDLGDGGRPDENVRRLREALRDRSLTVEDAREAFVTLHPATDKGRRDTAVKAFNRSLRKSIEAGLILHDETSDSVRFALVDAGQNRT